MDKYRAAGVCNGIDMEMTTHFEWHSAFIEKMLQITNANIHA